MARASKTKQTRPRPVPYMHQLGAVLGKDFNTTPSGQTITLAELRAKAKRNADDYDPTIIGERFKTCFTGHLETLCAQKIVELDLEGKTMQLTRAGIAAIQRMRQEIGDNTDARAELESYFRAAKREFGRLKALTKAEIVSKYEHFRQENGTLRQENDELRDRVHELKKQLPIASPFLPTLPNELLRRIDILKAAGPSDQQFSPTTPMRKSASMTAAYPTPESLPRERKLPALAAFPPPSPSPRGSFTNVMDVDEERALASGSSFTERAPLPSGSSFTDRDHGALVYPPPPPPTSTVDLEAQLIDARQELKETRRDIEAQLAIVKKELQRTRGQLADLTIRYIQQQTDVACYQRQIIALKRLHTSDAVLRQTLQDEITVLHELQQLTNDENEQARWDLENERDGLKKQRDGLEKEKDGLVKHFDSWREEQAGVLASFTQTMRVGPGPRHSL
ncbi:hypothetical protein DFH06DRAFT_481078 [Mycena polygramma]|nr:hypothetical protein DFH06DRAFT_481078 [Mycena polygramma]